MRKMPYKKARHIDTTELCCHGCGNLGKFITTGGTIICDSSSQKCPIVKSRNSEAVKRAHERKGESWLNSPLSSEVRDRMAWNKGLTKKDHPSIMRMSQKLSERN